VLYNIWYDFLTEKNDKEKWITVNGVHILLKDGETPEDAVNRKFGADGKKGAKSDVKKEPKIKHHKPRGDVRGTVNVDGHEVEYGDDGEHEEIVKFRDDNDLWDKVEVDLDNINDTTRQGERIEDGLKDLGLTSDVPYGSAYLTQDGTWVSAGDQDHRPTMRQAMAKAGVKITGGKPGDSASIELRKALDISGTIRVGARSGDLSLDLHHPLTRAQRNSLEDYIISKGIKPDNINISLLNKMDGKSEDSIKRLITSEF